MVAKESRMVLDRPDGMTESESCKRFVRTFIKAQKIARRLSIEFNNRLKANH
jgi:hypothetical protein